MNPEQAGPAHTAAAGGRRRPPGRPLRRALAAASRGDFRRFYRHLARAAATGDRPSLAAEFGRVNAELQRLQAVLRQHGLDTDNGAA